MKDDAQQKLDWQPILEYPDNLPITNKRLAILELLAQNQVLIVAGETGSGKTTQLPKLCLEAGLGRRSKIGCTQPRRVAAYSVAERIAQEVGTTLGEYVGYKVRFNDQTSPFTAIQVMTDGVLLNEIQFDPLLKAYEVIIIDEAHERSLNIDFLIGYLRTLKHKRPDLKIIITSATINTGLFSAAFDQAPVVHIEGRTFPVELIYDPFDDQQITYIEAAAGWVKQLIEGYPFGDILVFLPGQKDIQELKEILAGQAFPAVEILPLFSRLTHEQQLKIFQPSSKQKIILSTNIAETSLTIPGIRYVIDTGLVRMSRYNPNTRTQRLPIEPIAQSCAQQRQGRAGRVADGMCIRLYDQKDFEQRPAFTIPEIQRSNLAEVILKLMVFKLGHIETFPFLEPPHPRAVQAGYRLLEQLGAIDSQKNLQPIGHQLAHLPVDPTVGRMLIQARQEHALKEVLIIAAALSIQDPRERPLDQEDLADAAHRGFVHPKSDFLTLLHLWEAYHVACEQFNQKALRQFCKKNYLSYMRMREWRDLHTQLTQALKAIKIDRVHAEPATYEAIHRSLLVGLLHHVAQKIEGHYYAGTHNKKLYLFPGSALFDKKWKKPKPQGALPGAAQRSTSPDWILCAQVLETSQVYAHTAAQIDPIWVVGLAEHLTHSSFVQPYWSKKNGRVLVKEKIYLYGLLVHTRSIGYGKINPGHATEIFIREALVVDDIDEAFAFLKHNRLVYEEVQKTATRLRLPGLWDMEEKLYQFYAERIEQVSAVAELFDYVRRVPKDRLNLTPSALLDTAILEEALKLYPDHIDLFGHRIDIAYSYQPGDLQDGAILKIPLAAWPYVTQAWIDQAIPGYIRYRIEDILKTLSKDKRRLFSGNDAPIDDIHQQVQAENKPIRDVVIAYGQQKYGWQETDFQPEPLDTPWRPQICVITHEHKPLVQGCCLTQLQAALAQLVKQHQNQLQHSKQGEQLWASAYSAYPRHLVSPATLPAIPEKFLIGHLEGIPLYGYPGLKLENPHIVLSLFKTQLDAQLASVPAYRSLLKQALDKQWAYFEKDLSMVQKLMPYYISMGSIVQLKTSILEGVEKHFFQIPVPWPIQPEAFHRYVEKIKPDFTGLAIKITDCLQSVLIGYQSLCQHPQYKNQWVQELKELIHHDFIRQTPYLYWFHLERYLKAFKSRMERAHLNPQKDIQRSLLLEPWQKIYCQYAQDPRLSAQQKRTLTQLRWLLEEYKVSIFAQELGTSEPISIKKLQQMVDLLEKK